MVVAYFTYISGSVDGRNLTNSIDDYKVESIEMCDILKAGSWDRQKSQKWHDQLGESEPSGE